MMDISNVEYVSFKSAEIVTSYNDRLIFNVEFRLDESIRKEQIIVYEGKYHFHGGNILRAIKERSKCFDKASYEFCMDAFSMEINSWCNELGVPAVTEEF